MSRDINPFGLRMQPELRAALEAAAATGGRSLNSEISGRLQRSLEAESQPNAKRELALKELRDAAALVLKLWEQGERTQAEDALLREAMDDLGLWHRQVEKLEGLQEAFGIIQRAAEANRKPK